MTNARIYQSNRESSTVGTPKVRIFQSELESSTVGTPKARIFQALLEYSIKVANAPMIPTVVFPTAGLLAGMGYSVHRRPTFSTRVAKAVSGRSVRSPFFVVPLYEFELTFDVLLSGPASGAVPASTLQLLMGFFLQMQGQYAGFLFTDPDFNQVTGGAIGTGDGVTTTFTLLRTVGAYSEAIQAANVVTAVYQNGVAQPGANWAVVNGNQIQFATAPAAGVSISADFTYYFVCAFEDDVHDYEEFMYKIHTLKSCKFQTVRTS